MGSPKCCAQIIGGGFTCFNFGIVLKPMYLII